MHFKLPSPTCAPEGQGRGVRRHRQTTDGPHPVDVHVGSRVRLRRTMLGLSQEKLGEAVGLTFQQIQKYERGANRIGCSRLYQFSHILDIPVSFFFEDMPDDAVSELKGAKLTGKVKNKGGLSDSSVPFYEEDPLARQETLELVRAYYRIQDPKVRKRLYDLLRSMANLPDAAG